MSAAVGVPFAFFVGLFLIIFVAATLVKRASRRPVQWPGAAVGVATVRTIRSQAPARNGKTTVVLDVAVETPSGAPFTAVLPREVPDGMIQFLQPGLRFPAMYRHGRREKVKIARGEPAPRAEAFYDAVLVRDGLLTPGMIKARREGIRAVARAFDVLPTGTNRSGLPEFVYRLLLQTADGRRVDVTHRRALLHWEAAVLGSGATLPAKIIPGDPDAVVLSFSPIPSPQQAAAGGKP